MSNKKVDQEMLEKALELVNVGQWDEANGLLDGYGIENVNVVDRGLLFVNMGDAYDLTVCQEDQCEPFIGCWGDWAEEAERDYEEETGTVLCPYCGNFMPVDVGDDPRNIICDICGYPICGDDENGGGI